MLIVQGSQGSESQEVRNWNCSTKKKKKSGIDQRPVFLNYALAPLGTTERSSLLDLQRGYVKWYLIVKSLEHQYYGKKFVLRP